jgi:hypothetical protein
LIAMTNMPSIDSGQNTSSATSQSPCWSGVGRVACSTDHRLATPSSPYSTFSIVVATLDVPVARVRSITVSSPNRPSWKAKPARSPTRTPRSPGVRPKTRKVEPNAAAPAARPIPTRRTNDSVAPGTGRAGTAGRTSVRAVAGVVVRPFAVIGGSSSGGPALGAP